MFSNILIDPCPPFYPWNAIIGFCIERVAMKKKEKEERRETGDKEKPEPPM